MASSATRDARAVASQEERFIIRAAGDFSAAALPLGVFHRPRGHHERLFNGLDDLLAEGRIVAAGLGTDENLRSDDVGRFAAADHADVARAAARGFFDFSQPAAAVQVGNGQRGDGNRGDAPLRTAPAWLAMPLMRISMR